MVIPTDNLQNNKIDSALYNKESILVKMHGDIEDPTNLILTEDSYNEVYGKNPDEPDFDLAMPNFLRKILKKNPLLFLGCSLDKDRTCNVIKKCIGNCRQFAFLELPKETENKENPLVPSIRGEANKLEEHLRERKKYLIGELNIQPIWYPYGEHKEAYSVFFQQLCQDLGIRSEHFNYCLKSKMPYTKKVFHGRDNLIKEIHEIIHSGKKSIFLQGIGGIGKSETAKQYAKKYEKEYKNVLYLTYSSGLKELVCNSKTIEIENLQKYPDEKSEEFFRRKLELLKTMTNEKTLFIIDNFDVDTDPDLDDFLSGNYHVILTTRNSHPGYETKFVEAVKNWEDVLKIFTENYGRDITDNNDISCLKEIFSAIYNHTLAIELIAKQMAESSWNPQKMLEVLKAGNFITPLEESIPDEKRQELILKHICEIFDISGLNEAEEKIMMYLSLIGERGIPVTRFREWANLSSSETMKNLMNKRWVFNENEERYSQHPLVIEVVHSRLSPSVENCKEFLDNMAEFCYHAWYRNYQENVDVADNVLKVLDYFKSSLEDDVHNFSILASFLWQVGKFDESISCQKEVYYASLQKYGEKSIATGYVAKDLGGCYFNSGYLNESIEWYKKELDFIKQASMEDNEDLAMAYEKVARCYTWEYGWDLGQDADKAKEKLYKAKKNFQIALEMRIRLRDALANGEKKKIFIKYGNYNLNIAQERIGESYMEMGRMYQVDGQYKEALEYAKKDEEIISKYNPKNISGLAYAYYDQGVCYYHLGLQEKVAGNEDTAMENWKLAVEKLKKALKQNLERRGDLAIDTIDNQEYLADTYQRISNEVGLMASDGYAKANNMAKKLMGENCLRSRTIGEKVRKVGEVKEFQEV